MIEKDIPGPAKVLGIAGLMPFIISTGLIFILKEENGRLMVFDLLVHYAAVILSFLGAVHWGVFMTSRNTHPTIHTKMWMGFGWSVVPALIAWIATQMVLMASLVTLIVGFSAAFFFDVWSVKKGWTPSWYLQLRKYLTLIVLICLGIAILKTRF